MRTVRRLTRFGHDRDQRTVGGPTSPSRDSTAAGHAPSWRHRSERVQADENTARRLRLDVGAPVMSTRYLFMADGEPIQMSWSREPLAVTGGTDVELPEDGAAVGVVARMDRIGVRITESEERVTARPATQDEIAELALPARSFVFVIERTYHAAERPVETADIMIPLDRYEPVDYEGHRWHPPIRSATGSAPAARCSV